MATIDLFRTASDGESFSAGDTIVAAADRLTIQAIFLTLAPLVCDASTAVL